MKHVPGILQRNVARVKLIKTSTQIETKMFVSTEIWWNGTKNTAKTEILSFGSPVQNSSIFFSPEVWVAISMPCISVMLCLRNSPDQFPILFFTRKQTNKQRTVWWVTIGCWPLGICSGHCPTVNCTIFSKNDISRKFVRKISTIIESETCRMSNVIFFWWIATSRKCPTQSISKLDEQKKCIITNCHHKYRTLLNFPVLKARENKTIYTASTSPPLIFFHYTCFS